MASLRKLRVSFTQTFIRFGFVLYGVEPPLYPFMPKCAVFSIVGGIPLIRSTHSYSTHFWYSKCFLLQCLARCRGNCARRVVTSSRGWVQGSSSHCGMKGGSTQAEEAASEDMSVGERMSSQTSLEKQYHRNTAADINKSIYCCCCCC